MTSNVLPLFWQLASSSKDTRLTASAELVSSLQTFQQAFLANKPKQEEDEDEDEDDDSDDESGVEEDGDDFNDEDKDEDPEAQKLDKALAKDNAQDVVYTVKRLVRGLASSRESSRLGFAVALTEVRFSVPLYNVQGLMFSFSAVQPPFRLPKSFHCLFVQLP